MSLRRWLSGSQLPCCILSLSSDCFVPAIPCCFPLNLPFCIIDACCRPYRSHTLLERENARLRRKGLQWIPLVEGLSPPSARVLVWSPVRPFYEQKYPEERKVTEELQCFGRYRLTVENQMWADRDARVERLAQERIVAAAVAPLRQSMEALEQTLSPGNQTGSQAQQQQAPPVYTSTYEPARPAAWAEGQSHTIQVKATPKFCGACAAPVPENATGKFCAQCAAPLA